MEIEDSTSPMYVTHDRCPAITAAPKSSEGGSSLQMIAGHRSAQLAQLNSLFSSLLDSSSRLDSTRLDSTRLD